MASAIVAPPRVTRTRAGVSREARVTTRTSMGSPGRAVRGTRTPSTATSGAGARSMGSTSMVTPRPAATEATSRASPRFWTPSLISTTRPAYWAGRSARARRSPEARSVASRGTVACTAPKGGSGEGKMSVAASAPTTTSPARSPVSMPPLASRMAASASSPAPFASATLRD